MTTLAFLGDVMLGRLVSAELGKRRPESFWGSTLPVLRAADAVFVNLECAITKCQRPWARTPKVFHFRAEPTAIAVLKAAGVRYAGLANNHVLDFETGGLQETLRRLDGAGIAHAGAGCTMTEAMRPALVNVGGLQVGVIALTDNEPDFAARRDRPGVYYTPILDNPDILTPIGDAVRRLRDEGADLVVLSPHWGPNMVLRPPSEFRRFAAMACGMGVDLVHGHSAHIFQGVERCGDSLILYDTGDFLDDYAVDRTLRNDWSFIFLVEVAGRRIERLRMLPVRLGFAQVDLASGEEFLAITRRMLHLCRDLGSEPVETPEGLLLEVGDTARSRPGYPAVAAAG